MNMRWSFVRIKDDVPTALCAVLHTKELKKCEHLCRALLFLL